MAEAGADLSIADLATVRAISRAGGWVLDVDGCIVRTATAGGAGGVPIDGAVDLVRWLKDTGKRLIVCTNASQQPAARYAAHLRTMGFDIADEEMMTAATGAAAYIAKVHGRGPVIALGDTGLTEALEAEGVALAPGRGDGAVAVIVGAADQYRSSDISAACLAIADRGAAHYVTVDTPWFHGGLGRAVSSSTAIARAIAAITEVPPIVCGKPSAAIAEVLTSRLGGPAAGMVVVGDMASIEVKMARDMGAFGVLVLSGGTRASDVPALPPEHQPHFCAADVGALFEALCSI
jgi:HAD superfamily hydrolase (TIGR01450 family)